MNPLFTRSVGGNLLFGNLPECERLQMQNRLKSLVRGLNIPASITAGLGSLFVALGHVLIKTGGHLAFVLPRAMVSGVAWEATRRLLSQITHYHVRYVIVSHQSGRWNFSENTKLSECLIIAKRLGVGDAAGPTKFVNLWVQPRTSIEALTYAKMIASRTGSRVARLNWHSRAEGRFKENRRNRDLRSFTCQVGSMGRASSICTNRS